MRTLIALLIVTMLGCTNYHKYTPTASATFEPRTLDYTIDFIADGEPERGYVSLGIAEARGENLGEALPLLKELAREYGGSALIHLKTTQVYLAISTYSVTVVRYK